MATLNHTHSWKFFKKKLAVIANKTTALKEKPVEIYMCTDPHCTYKVEKAFLVGKASLCECGREFVLTYTDLRRARPKCIDCSNTTQAKSYKQAKKIMENLLSQEDSIEPSEVDLENENYI